MRTDRRRDVEQVLDGMVATGGSDDLASTTTQRHLRYLGASLCDHRDHGTPVRLGVADGHRLENLPTVPQASASVSWADPGSTTIINNESLLQARCGLMEAHGRNCGTPKELGIELVSVAAGVLNVQALLASLLSQIRGGSVRAAETSAMGAGLLFMSQYVAAATSEDARPVLAPASEPGPPFRSADGHWFELEILDGDIWKSFWDALGLHGPQVGQAWARFVQRYATGMVSLPGGPHATTRQFTLDQLLSVAERTGASICRIRASHEVIEDLRRSSYEQGLVPPPWDFCSADAPATGCAHRGASAGDPLPLAGLRVVEVTRRIQGPLCGLLLQMLGAEIVRVEPPGGDSLRLMPPLAGDCSARFLALNRDKPVVEINLKSSSGRTDLLDLIEGADAFVHNLAPGKAAELRLDADDMWAVNPGLVYTYASGWGSAFGDRRPPLGTDFLVQAQSALGETLNPADDPPFNSLVTITDMLGGMMASEGTIAGLVLRSRTGRGCRIATSLLAASLDLQAHRLEPLSQGESGKTGTQPRLRAWDGPLQTQDGFLALALDHPATLSALFHACGVAPTSADTEKLVIEHLMLHPSHYWQQLFASAGIASVPVSTNLCDLAADPHLGKLFTTVAGSALVRSPWRFSTQ